MAYPIQMTTTGRPQTASSTRNRVSVQRPRTASSLRSGFFTSKPIQNNKIYSSTSASNEETVDYLRSFYQAGVFPEQKSHTVEVDERVEVHEVKEKTKKALPIKSIPGYKNLDIDNWHEDSGSDNSLKKLLGNNVKLSCHFVPRRGAKNKKLLHTEAWNERSCITLNQLNDDCITHGKTKRPFTTVIRSKKKKHKMSKKKVRNTKEIFPTVIEQSAISLYDHFQNSYVKTVITDKHKTENKRELSACEHERKSPRALSSRTNTKRIDNINKANLELTLIKLIMKRENELENLRKILNISMEQTWNHAVLEKIRRTLLQLRELTLQIVKLAVQFCRESSQQSIKDKEIRKQRGQLGKNIPKRMKASRVKKKDIRVKNNFKDQGHTFQEKLSKIHSNCNLVHPFTHGHDHVFIHFLWEGQNYLVKMILDLDFCDPFVPQLRKIAEFRNVNATRRNPFLLPFNLDEFYAIASRNSECPEGELWKILNLPNFDSESVDYYLSALVICREEIEHKLVSKEEPEGVSPREQESVEEMAKIIMKTCVRESKEEQAVKPACWFNESSKEDMSFETAHKKRAEVLPLTPFFKKKVMKTFSERFNDKLRQMQQNVDLQNLQKDSAHIIRSFIIVVAYKVKKQKKTNANRIQNFVRTQSVRYKNREQIKEMLDTRKEEHAKAWIVKAHKKALIIQCWWRQLVALHALISRRRHYRSTILQNWYRCVVAKYRFKLFIAALRFQCCFRCYSAKSKLKKLRLDFKKKNGAVGMQKLFRGQGGRKRFLKIKRDRSSTNIQTCFRRYIAIIGYTKQVKVRNIQNTWRSYSARRTVESARNRRNASRKIQRLARWWRAEIESRVNVKIFEWKSRLGKHGLIKNYRIHKVHLNVLAHTLSAKEVLKHAYKFSSLAEERKRLMQILSTKKVKSSYIKYLIYTRHLTKDMIEKQTSEYTKRLLEIQRKFKYFERAAKSRVRMEILYLKAKAIFEKEDTQYTGSKAYVLRKIHRFEDEVGKLLLGEMVAENFSHWPNTLFVTNWEQKRTLEMEKVRRLEARMCADALGKYIHSSAVNRAIRRRKRKNFEKIFAKKMKHVWESMQGEDSRACYLRNYLTASYEEIERVRVIFDTFDKNNSNTIDEFEFQQLAYTLGCTLSLRQVRGIMKNNIGINNDQEVCFDDFAIWWLCDVESKKSNFANPLKLAALKIKLQFLHSKRFAKNLFRKRYNYKQAS